MGIGPGWIRSAWNKNTKKEQINAMISPQLTHRLVEPEEIADVMEMIIKNKSMNVTTAILDGGLGAPII